METLNPWLTPATLEEELKISRSTQAKYRMDRKIPFYKIGGKYIKYKRKEIYDWIESNKVEVVA